ncbi:unnamed protein product [Acanthoscelides obtectus]|uniref:protein acetyllysine N-acetyltransferase n=1 Tax=Acanthoscelides obtectus TaxID=200917 RepID=A0A9P0KKJ9_ACAOB|nr:unnamed protein product [Acanthoscelides obtectus]CAK1667658.1 NAD-dependent protein deacetylase sirtuin-1 [Acanthoscelides obtectus]
MDSYPHVGQHESRAKRIKLDLGDSNISELCNGEVFSCFSTTTTSPIDVSEGTSSADCDSGYEASTMESMPTPSRRDSPGRAGLSADEAEKGESVEDEEEDDDDNASTVSELSGLSDLSGQDWKPMAGSMIWIQQQMQKGTNPRSLLSDLGVDYDQIPEYVDDVTIWKIIINMFAEPPRRNKLRHVNTLDDIIRLLKGAQNIIVLTGAGVSVSCGIPDFRSRDGIYSRLAIDFPNLPDPQAMFDISYFSQDPRPFYKFARDIYPGKFQPSPCHRFIKLLEKNKKLLRNYTQNIDTLEKVAGIERVIECHGSFATATCTKCGHKVKADAIRDVVLAQKIPLCEICHVDHRETSISTDDFKAEEEGRDYRGLVASGIMKPDIVFFGEGLPDSFHTAMAEDRRHCDLLLVIGSSLKVRPVALIPGSLPPNVPQVLINREPLPHCRFDVELMGDCDAIVNHLCQLLGNKWEEGVYSDTVLRQSNTLLPLEEDPYYPEDSDNACSCRQFTSVTSASSSSATAELYCRKCAESQQKSITTDNLEEGKKERHMSIDSARDSGIGENSNFTDRCEESSDETEGATSSSSGRFGLVSKNHEVKSSDSMIQDNSQSPTSTDLRGYWQPKVKRSLADRLPQNGFHLIPPSRYIFPGAEVYYDPDEKLHYEVDDASSMEDDDSDRERERDEDRDQHIQDLERQTGEREESISI